MGKFNGKVFLELGTSVASVDIVKYAKSEGAYVIVTDYLPEEKSEAKKYADETAMISTLDVDELIKFAREKKIDGVFCGVSEQNLLSVNAIAKELNLPCYFTKEQWDICQNKAEFKTLCETNDIPVPKRFHLSNIPTDDELNAIEYPVIVKPVDQGAAIGIHICNTADELLKGYKDACEKSYSGKAIIEQYIIGDEFSAAYTIVDGNYELSTIGDKYLNREQNELTPLPEAYVYPSKYLDVFLNDISPKIVKMFKSIGLMNGVVFVQGITDGVNFVIFEAGLRMGGTALYRFVSEVNGINIMQLLVDYSINGKIDANINLEDPTLKGKRCCLLSLLNGGGLVKKICGFDEARNIQGVIESEERYVEGETIEKSGTLKQSHLRFFVVRDSAKELKTSVEQIQNLIKVTDENGKNMLLSKFDASKLLY